MTDWISSGGHSPEHPKIVVGKWERVVAYLTFSHGILEEVWGTCMILAEWRTRDLSNLHA